MAEPFVFETTYDPAALQEQWVEETRRGTPRGDQVMIGAALLGFVLLIWPYTFALGAGILAVCTFGYAMKNRARTHMKRAVWGSDPASIHVRITDEGYTVSEATFTAQGTWKNVRGFFETPSLLVLHTRFTGRMYLSIAAMREAGVYDRIRALADERRSAELAQLQAAT